MLRQRTLKSLIGATGVGLHTGQKVRLALRPAQPDTGIVFFTNSGSRDDISSIVRRQPGTGERQNGQFAQRTAAWGG